MPFRARCASPLPLSTVRCCIGGMRRCRCFPAHIHESPSDERSMTLRPYAGWMRWGRRGLSCADTHAAHVYRRTMAITLAKYAAAALSRRALSGSGGCEFFNSVVFRGDLWMGARTCGTPAGCTGGRRGLSCAGGHVHCCCCPVRHDALLL